MHRLLREMGDLLLPTGCVACRGWIPRRDGDAEVSIVCPVCRGRLPAASWPRCRRCHAPRGTGRAESDDCIECRAWSPALERARYAHVLAPPASDLVHALKYEGWRELADPMGRAMAVEVRRHLDVSPTGWCVVPVATTVRRVRTRGYNQAHLLAERVAGALGLPCREALARPSAPRSQTALAPEARRENVRDAFRVVDAGGIGGRAVLLVDDVLTTGATAGAAADTLVAAGARSVAVVAFARALPWLEARRRDGTAA